jgi:hypothetical protein
MLELRASVKSMSFCIGYGWERGIISASNPFKKPKNTSLSKNYRVVDFKTYMSLDSNNLMGKREMSNVLPPTKGIKPLQKKTQRASNYPGFWKIASEQVNNFAQDLPPLFQANRPWVSKRISFWPLLACSNTGLFIQIRDTS